VSTNIRVGIIGGGRIGKLHATNMTTRVSGVDVVAIADPFANSALENWAVGWGIPKVLKEYKAILTDPDVDAVLICSPSNTHAAISQEAALAKKHVFCEKPLDQNPEVVRETLEVINKAKVVFQIGFNRRFDHNFRALRTAIADGSIGDIHLLCITSRDPEPPPLEYIRGSGGLFMDMAIHDFDMARFLTGSEVVKVHAAGAVLVNPEIGREGDIDTAITTLWFENGALGVIDNSRRATYGYDQRAEVFGSKGCVSSLNDTPSTVRVSDAECVRSDKPLFFFLERYAESFAEEIRDFVNAVNKNAEVPGAKDALNSVLIAHAAQKSLETGGPVDVKRG